MGNRQHTRLKKELKDKAKRIEEKNEKSRVRMQQEKKQGNKIDCHEEGYAAFFISKSDKKMVLYDKFPNLDQIISYYSKKTWNAPHPLEDYGKFEVRELVEVIKTLYSIKKQREYQIFTMGYLEKNYYSLLEGKFQELIPKLLFLIGNEDTLKTYQNYKNLFLGNACSFDSFNQSMPDLIAVFPREGTVRDTLGIQCKCPGFPDNYFEAGIKYYDYVKEQYLVSKYLSNIQIFDSCFFQKVNSYKGIQDTLSFPIHLSDDFIA